MTAIDVKAEIRERKRLRKLGLLDQPAPPVIEPVFEPPTVTVPDDSGPTAEPDEPKPSGRIWVCKVCGTRVQAPQIACGWLSVNRWPPDRKRHRPITNTFCGPACARDYLDRVELSPNVTYPQRKAAA